MHTTVTETHSDLLRSLQTPGKPLVLPNAWDAASARAVVAAGFPVVATTSAGVAALLGYEDHQDAPPEEMFAAAARIARAVDVPVTVDAEAGYGLEPGELVDALIEIGAAGANLEDSDYATGGLRDPDEHAGWLRAVRDAASERDHGLVINARIDVFVRSETPGKDQLELVDEALRRAHAYVEADADSVFPIVLYERDALEAFMGDAPGLVNVLKIPPAPSIAELAELGVARVSYGGMLHHEAMDRFGDALEALKSS